MYKRVKIKKLGRKKSHREALIQNQLRTLFENGTLKTTTTKAKSVKSVAQSLLSDMENKKISIETRRKLLRMLGKKELLEKALKYAESENHGISIRKVGFRSGDNAEVSRVELIGFGEKKKEKVEKKETKVEKKEKQTEKQEQKTNVDINKKDVKNIGSGKASKSKRKASERVRTRSGL
jgi:large subunit ribosomal protein L17